MIEEKIYDIKFIYDEGLIKVINESNQKFRLNFLNPDKGFYGFNHMNFNPGTWVSTKPTQWSQGKVENRLEIILTSKDKKYLVEFNYDEKKFKNITDEYCYLENYEVIKKKISILITAYDCVDYIDETLNKFFEIIDRKEQLDVEILIGIDGCDKTVRHISNKSYPNYVNVLYSDKNYGMTLMKNSLIYNASNEKVLMFDSDDIPTENLIDIVYDELNNNDVVYYNYYKFKDGTNYGDEKNLELISDNYMGGTFGIKREKFLKMNGFFPWRVQSDDEFKNRIKHNNENNIKLKVIKDYLFYYRIRNKSLSRNKKFGIKSKIRRIYLDIMTNKFMYGKFQNPERFKYNNKLIYIQ